MNMGENYWVFIMLLANLLHHSFGERGAWSAYGQYEYYVSSGGVSKSFSDAQTYCRNQGGELALVKTQEIQQFIQTLVTSGSGIPYGFYIGLRDIYANETFVWTDGEPLAYTSWTSGEPNNIGFENCVTLGWQYTYLSNLPWRNQICVIGSTGPKGFVCQKNTYMTTMQSSQSVTTSITITSGQTTDAATTETTTSETTTNDVIATSSLMTSQHSSDLSTTSSDETSTARSPTGNSETSTTQRYSSTVDGNTGAVKSDVTVWKFEGLSFVIGFIIPTVGLIALSVIFCYKYKNK